MPKDREERYTLVEAEAVAEEVARKIEEGMTLAVLRRTAAREFIESMQGRRWSAGTDIGPCI